MTRFPLISLCFFLFANILSWAATNELPATVEQAVAEYWVIKPKRISALAKPVIKVDAFCCSESYRGENIGSLVAEVVSRQLSGMKQLQVLSELGASGRPESREEPVYNRPSASVTLTGEIASSEGFYNIRMDFIDSESGQAVISRRISMEKGALEKILRKHLRWKNRVWTLQPYLQALNSGRYLTDRCEQLESAYTYSGVPVSFEVKTEPLAIDETAEFTGGVRLTYRNLLMLDVAYTAHGFSTSQGQTVVTMTDLIDPSLRTIMVMNVSTTAMSASLNGKKALFGDLSGFAGVGWERTEAALSVSSRTKLWYAVPGKKIEIRGSFLSLDDPGPSGMLTEGGKLVDRAGVPFIRFGFEWKPRNFGFIFLTTYRMENGDFRPLMMAIEEIYQPYNADPQTISFKTMEAARYRLPRLSLGAAFTLSL